ncbi:unnamed protein product [Linum tenue]|uniref:Gnk2-homologous domain-containing protein n=1 Tax=Linum tenue TaxID=586396 RepID=A0AAV0RC57_9ROSI|nr:unnamed protein product [Linum tenue]
MAMSTSCILILAVLLIFSDGFHGAVAKTEPLDFNKHRVDGNCGEIVDASPEMRVEALRSLDLAIDVATKDKKPNTCAMATGSSIFAAANCSKALSKDKRMDDCRHCLFNAQFRAVDKECPQKFGGWIKLVDCYVRYDTYKFCE